MLRIDRNQKSLTPMANQSLSEVGIKERYDLQQLGYEIIDADQWSRSYWHNQDHNKTIELDELEDPTALVRLILRYGDLDEADIGSAEEQLASLYDKIYQMCNSRYEDNCYEPSYCTLGDKYNSSQNEKLTYEHI